tara:strand:+ start:2001 stop:2282 length:282 start_codon:yes stop_codon:yes gene_type:complete
MENTNISNFLNESDCESFENIGDIKFNKYLARYTSKTGTKRFKTKKEAYIAMLVDSEAGGIVKSNNGYWTVRKGKILKIPSMKHQPEIACLKK